MKTMTTAKVSQRKMIQRLVQFSAQVNEQFESFLMSVGVEPAQLTENDWSEIEEGEERIARRFGFVNAAIARRAAAELRLS